MTWALSASGTITATIGTEVTLATDTTNATYYYEVDMTNMANGDVTELRMYTTTLNGGTSRVAWKSTFGPVQPVADIAASPAQPVDQFVGVTLKQTSGTGRQYFWKLLRI